MIYFMNERGGGEVKWQIPHRLFEWKVSQQQQQHRIRCGDIHTIINKTNSLALLSSFPHSAASSIHGAAWWWWSLLKNRIEGYIARQIVSLAPSPESK